MIIQIIGQISCISHPIATITDVSDGQRYIGQRSHPLKVIKSRVTVHYLHIKVAVLLQVGLTGRI